MKNEILSLLNDVFPGIDFEGSDTLVDDGVLTSLLIVQIIGELSVEYGIEFSFEDLVPENFNSLDSIVSMVERLTE